MRDKHLAFSIKFPCVVVVVCCVLYLLIAIGFVVGRAAGGKEALDEIGLNDLLPADLPSDILNQT